MHGSTPDSENSVLAIASAVADDSVRIARMLTGGDVVGAMDGVIALVDALDGFLSDIRESTYALQRCSPQLARACAQYRDRIDSLLVRIEETLVTRDLVGLALALEHGVAKALRDYAYYDAPLNRMSEQSVAA